MPRPERPVDPEAGVVQRFAVELRELRRRAGSPGYRELALRAHYSATTLAQAARGDRLPTLPVTLAYVRACGADPEVWEARWRAAAAVLGPREPIDEDGSGLVDGRPPYVGLAVYGSEDADLFHGREGLVGKLIDRLSRQRLVALVGASGSGKSSLLRAGLLPEMSAAGDRWSTLLITPGVHPLQECGVRLGRELHISPAQLAAEFAQRPGNLGLAVRQLLVDRPDDVELLLVVDQFEEVFTLCGDLEERDEFVAALVAAAHDAGSRTRVVLGLRADFYAHCAGHPRLVEALQDAQVLVGPMTSDELTRAIVQPANRAGLMVEKALVTTILGEAADRPGALPFVSHALWETWRRRHGNGLFLSSYRDIGGVNGAIAQSAEQVYGDLDEDQRRIARRILLRLTALGEGTEDTRRRIARAELDMDKSSADVLERLATARLITLAEDSVEIAHEALIRGWPLLREWLAADRESLRAQRRLTEAATEWERNGRDEAFLYRGRLLAAWADREPDGLNDMERAFLSDSIARQAREQILRRRRLRLTLTGLGVTVVVVSILAVLALVQANRAADERDRAFSRQLAANARNQLQVDPELALLLAMRAVEIAPTTETDAVLRQAILDSRAQATIPTGHGRALGVAFSPDGRQIATTGDDGTIRVWDRTGQTGPVVLHGHTGEAWSPVFSRDGRYLASGGFDSTVRVWDRTTPGDPIILRGHRGLVAIVAFSPDGQFLASTADDGIRIWDPTGRREPVLLTGHDGPVYGLSFSPDGQFLGSSGTFDGTVRIWETSGWRERVVLRGERGSQGRLAFSPDGRRLASTSTDGSVRVWDPTGERAPVALRGHQGGVISLAHSPDGRALASGGQDGTIQIMNAGADTNPVVLRGHRGEVWGVAFSPDGQQIASVGTDGTLRLWFAAGPSAPRVLGSHDGSAWCANFTADGSRIASGGQDATVRVRDADGGNEIVLRGHGDEILDVKFSPDRSKVASASKDGTVRIWDTTAAAAPEPRVLTGRTGPVWSVAFSPDGQRLADSGNDGIIRVWPTTGNGDPVVLRGHAGPIRQVTISPDGQKVASAGKDGTVRIWPISGNGTPLILRGHQGPVFSVAFAPDSQRVVTGGHDGTVRIWPISGNGNPVVRRGHHGLVWSVGFSPAGRHVVTSGNDGTVRIWATTGNGEPAVFRGYQASVETATFSPDGHQLLTAHDDGTIRTQQCEVCGSTDQVLALAHRRVTRQLTADELQTFGLAPPS